MANISSNPGTAAVLSFLLSGLGQIYNGQIKKGLWILTFSWIGVAATIIGAIFVIIYITSGFTGVASLLIGALLLILGIAEVTVLGIYSIFNAYRIASQRQD